MTDYRLEWYGDRILDKVDNKMEENILKSALKVEASAKEKCPVDTGRLRASITHEVRKLAKGLYYARVGTNVWYAPVQELGSGPIPPQPYLRPALEENWDYIKKKIGESMK